MISLTPDLTMQEILHALPGAQRALFRLYHIGGCSNCSFQPTETLQAVCHRNDLECVVVMDELLKACEGDAQSFLEPVDLAAVLADEACHLKLRLIDIRTQEESEQVPFPQAVHFTQELFQDLLMAWPKDQMLVLIDHQGLRGLDAAAYFEGHGFQLVRVLRGGIDAWSCEVDPSVPRYILE